ncbi:DNA-binding protein [Bacteroides sp. 51]|uniref:HU family DNA-binding protein n=1 Tax=Bacteroides sp. 51 TaxID=2302938 RepID=UPI0013D1CF2D|nr:DNA-binding protein [Bacteroides sp. 51]NDV83246.1 DNA-binding protein [Bacteroides sp. 51]
MSIKYKVVKQVFGYDKTKTVKYVAKSVTGEMLTFDKVRKQTAEICGMHRGVTNLVLDGLLDVLVNNLDMGHSVQLGEFGILRPGIRAKAQDEEKAVDAETVYRRKINFIPGKMLKNFLRDVSVTRVVPLETDYTNGGSATNPGGNNDDDDEVIDPGF